MKITKKMLSKNTLFFILKNKNILKEIQKRQIKSVEKLNTVLGIRKEAGRL